MASVSSREARPLASEVKPPKYCSVRKLVFHQAPKHEGGDIGEQTLVLDMDCSVGIGSGEDMSEASSLTVLCKNLLSMSFKRIGEEDEDEDDDESIDDSDELDVNWEASTEHGEDLRVDCHFYPKQASRRSMRTTLSELERLTALVASQRKTIAGADKKTREQVTGN